MAGLTEMDLSRGFRRQRKSEIRGDRRKHILRLNAGKTYGPGDNLSIKIPRLANNMTIIPGTLNLIYNMNITSAKSSFKNNLGKLIPAYLQIDIGGRIVYQNTHESVYRVYEDLWKSNTERTNLIQFGIANENTRKHISGEDTADGGVAPDVLMEKIFKNKQKISLNKILEDHGLYAPHFLQSEMSFTFYLPQVSEVLATQTNEAAGSYTISDLSLEYDTLDDKALADNTSSVYSGHYWIYEHVMREKSIDVAVGDDKLNIEITNPRSFARAIVILFTKKAGSSDSEDYPFPDIKSVVVAYSGESSIVFDKGIDKTYLFDEAKRFFHGGEDRPDQNMKIQDFYKDKFALVIDLRTIAEKGLAASGKKVKGLSSGVGLTIELTGNYTAELEAHPFLVSDGMVAFSGRDVSKIDT